MRRDRLHPGARALMDAAKRGEAPLSDDARERVHRSVLRRAALPGAAVLAATTASTAAKATGLAALLASPLLAPAAALAIAGAAFVLVKIASAPQALPHERPAAMAVHPAAPAAAPSSSALAPTPSPPRLDAEPASRSVAPPAATTRPSAPAYAVALPAHAFAPALAPAPGAALASAPGAAPAPAPGAALAPALASAPGPGPGPALGSAPAPPLAPAPAPLVAELAVLRAVRADLSAGRAREALTRLDRDGPLLDESPLAEEALAARVMALCQLGRTGEASAAQARLRAAWPRSPLAARLDAHLREGCAPPGAAVESEN
jgi:hypothetical protein